MTTKRINKAIAGLELEIIRGKGYQSFYDTKTGDQVGGMVCVCYLNQLSLSKWVEEAEAARDSDEGHELWHGRNLNY
jgi:hypothetical protein